MPASIVLLSAGLDSAVNFKLALDKGTVPLALTFDYGHRAARREAHFAGQMCERLGVKHQMLPLKWLGAITRTALVGKRRALPHPNEADLESAMAKRTAAQVWVPNRNGVFLAAAAAFAEALGADQVVAGFNAEEAETFPDNSPEFVMAFNKTLRFSTRTRVKVKSYTASLRKAAIVKKGLRIGAPLELVWCCYDGGRRLCGRCESCMRFRRAIRNARCETWFKEHHVNMPLRTISKRKRG